MPSSDFCPVGSCKFCTFQIMCISLRVHNRFECFWCNSRESFLRQLYLNEGFGMQEREDHVAVKVKVELLLRMVRMWKWKLLQRWLESVKLFAFPPIWTLSGKLFLRAGVNEVEGRNSKWFTSHTNRVKAKDEKSIKGKDEKSIRADIEMQHYILIQILR